LGARKGADNMEKAIKEILNTVIYLAIVFVLTFLFITFVMQRTDVSGQSMEPTLMDKDSLLVDKLSYRFKDPKRYDIVIFPYRYGNDEFFIKRVIGLPGERVRIDYDGNIYINDELLGDPYGAEVILDPGRAVEEVTLGEDEFFVMGDNRNHSMDSRDVSVGSINKKDILGRAFIRIYPFDRFGGLK
jgi:signal peptidase I